MIYRFMEDFKEGNGDIVIDFKYYTDCCKELYL